MAIGCIGPIATRADTVASLLGNFTVNQFCGLDLARDTALVHYVVVFGQLPALRELHAADTNADGVTSQAERDAYVATLAPGIAQGLILDVDGVSVPLRATRWTSSLPTEQGGFSLRIDIDFAAPLSLAAGTHSLQFANQNYTDVMGWHEIAVQSAAGIAVFDTNAYGNSLTGGLSEALRALPAAGPLDERSVHMRLRDGAAPADSVLLAPRPGTHRADLSDPGSRAPQNADGRAGQIADGRAGQDLRVPPSADWIARETRRLVDSISGPRVDWNIALLALLGALLLGAVHALSPGHGKTIVGAYLIGSRGTPRHAAFLGLTVTLTHTVTVFILGFATLYASRFMVPERLFPILSLVSALLVLGMGIVLLVQRLRAARESRVFHAVEPQLAQGRMALTSHGPGATAHAHDGGLLHSHGGGPLHSHLPPGARGEKVTWRGLLALGISGGLVPCPSAMVILLAAVALNKTAYGMLLVVAFSVGMAITLTAVGLAFLYARNRFRKPAATGRWSRLLPVVSAGTITALGIGLCIGALMSFGSH